MLNQRTQRDAKLDRAFHALADPARRMMMERLGRGPASVSELAQPLAMSLSAVVQHLQVLETSGSARTRELLDSRAAERARDRLTAPLARRILRRLENKFAGRVRRVPNVVSIERGLVRPNRAGCRRLQPQY